MLIKIQKKEVINTLIFGWNRIKTIKHDKNVSETKK